MKIVKEGRVPRPESRVVISTSVLHDWYAEPKVEDEGGNLHRDVARNDTREQVVDLVLAINECPWNADELTKLGETVYEVPSIPERCTVADAARTSKRDLVGATRLHGS